MLPGTLIPLASFVAIKIVLSLTPVQFVLHGIRGSTIKKEPVSATGYKDKWTISVNPFGIKKRENFLVS